MSLASRLGLLALAALICLVLNERDFAATDPRDAAGAAVAQFASPNAPTPELSASAPQWRVIASLAGLVLLAAFLVLDGAECWWRRCTSPPGPLP